MNMMEKQVLSGVAWFKRLLEGEAFFVSFASQMISSNPSETGKRAFRFL